MQLTLGIALLFVVGPVYAMGNPLVLYALGLKAVLLLFSAGWALSRRATWLTKAKMLAPILMSAIGVLVLGEKADYMKQAFWIEGGSLLLITVAFILAHRIFYASRSSLHQH